MTEQRRNFPDFYITSPQACPYLPGRVERKLFTHLSREKPPAVIDSMLRAGFRRSQHIAYTPYCDGCGACVPVRVDVGAFVQRKAQGRAWKANCDLVIRRVAAEATSEQYSLFRDYIDARHGDGGMAEMSVLDYKMMVEESMVDTFLTEYRLPPRTGSDPFETGELIATALCDRLSDGISMVYSFFTPEAPKRSLGTFMILEHIAYARAQGLPYIYLGYWINGSRKMRYKMHFTPQEHLTPTGWVRVPD